MGRVHDPVVKFACRKGANPDFPAEYAPPIRGAAGKFAMTVCDAVDAVCRPIDEGMFAWYGNTYPDELDPETEALMRKIATAHPRV
jgi:hypothetical protein